MEANPLSQYYREFGWSAPYGLPQIGDMKPLSGGCFIVPRSPSEDEFPRAPRSPSSEESVVVVVVVVS